MRCWFLVCVLVAFGFVVLDFVCDFLHVFFVL